MIDKRLIETLNSFQEFMLGDYVPFYVIRYCEQLNEVKWTWFYVQMMEAIMITDKLDYLFYVLKWILKTDFYDMIDPECRPKSLIKDKY